MAQLKEPVMILAFPSTENWFLSTSTHPQPSPRSVSHNHTLREIMDTDITQKPP